MSALENNTETAVAVISCSATDVNSCENSSLGGSNGKCGQFNVTPRFTQEEKEILYDLFHQHEEVIDIKFRKKQRSKYSVRDAWEQIVRDFNSHPGVNAIRNFKQIQKFWLNARLRKQYPFRSANVKESTAIKINTQQLVDNTIKDEPEFQMNTNEATEHNSQNEAFDEIEMDTSGVTQLEDDPIECHQQQPQLQQQQSHHQEHPQRQQSLLNPPATTLQTQQINVDQISAEKLTLNDLLQFKTARPREEIILQIKHPSDSTGSQITIPSPTRLSIPTHQSHQQTMASITTNSYNQQIISELKPQQITLAQFQAQQQIAHQQAAVTQQQQHQQQQHVKMQLHSTVSPQFATATPSFTCTTFNSMPGTGASQVTTAPVATVSTTVALESFEEKINYFKLKEVELRYKEEQVALEKKKIELSHAQEELKHMREINRLRIEEMKLKIRILQEEEKQLRKSLTVHS